RGPLRGSRQPTFADHRVDAGEEIVCAAPADGDRRHDRYAELCGQPIDVDLKPAMAGDVEHVEREDHRPADPLQLEREAQSDPEIGPVGDAHEKAWSGLAFEPPQHDIAGYDLVEAAGAQ